KGADEAEPGIVDEHVDRVVGVFESLCDGPHPVRGDEVGLQHFGFDLESRTKGCRCGIQPFAVTRHQNEAMAGCGELAAEFGTEPGGGPGDKSGGCHTPNAIDSRCSGPSRRAPAMAPRGSAPRWSTPETRSSPGRRS